MTDARVKDRLQSDKFETLILERANFEESDGLPEPMVIVLKGPRRGHRIALNGNELVIGRDHACDLPLPDDRSASRLHCRLFTDAGDWQVEDLGSTNGTYVERERISSRRTLSHGEFIYVGDSILKFFATQNAEAEWYEEIHRMAIYDALTRIHNRRAFMEFAEREVARSERYQRPLSLLMFDVDHFKGVNDRLGHLAGDTALRELAERIVPEIRREEMFARYAGDEFVIMLPETDAQSALTKAQRLVQLVGERPVMFRGHSFQITISIGVAELTSNLLSVSELIAVADGALYRAKRRGRNRASE